MQHLDKHQKGEFNKDCTRTKTC